MKLVTTKFKSGGLHEKHVVATWNLGEPSQHLLLGTGKPRKTCVEVGTNIREHFSRHANARKIPDPTSVLVSEFSKTLTVLPPPPPPSNLSKSCHHLVVFLVVF